jgi:hypothetical protein
LQLKGKAVTLAAKILSIIFVLACSFYFFLVRGTITQTESDAVVRFGLFIAFVTAPVDASLLIRNIKGLPDTETPPENTPSTLPTDGDKLGVTKGDHQND